MLAAHPATAHRVALRLAQWFVADEPPPDLTPLGNPPIAQGPTTGPVGPFVRTPRATGQVPRTRPGAPAIPGEATPPPVEAAPLPRT